jgi:hypothetical protein
VPSVSECHGRGIWADLHQQQDVQDLATQLCGATLAVSTQSIMSTLSVLKLYPLFLGDHTRKNTAYQLSGVVSCDFINANVDTEGTSRRSPSSSFSSKRVCTTWGTISLVTWLILEFQRRVRLAAYQAGRYCCGESEVSVSLYQQTCRHLEAIRVHWCDPSAANGEMWISHPCPICSMAHIANPRYI